MSKRRKKRWWEKLGKKRRKKATSGNVEWVKQWVYVYINFPLIFTCKIGVTGKFWRRWYEINKDNFGFDIPIFGWKAYGAYNIERYNRDRLCKWMRVNLFTGTGKTERFLLPALIPAILMTWSSSAIEILVYIFLFSLLIPDVDVVDLILSIFEIAQNIFLWIKSEFTKW